jgi:hypothetical protein
MMNRVRLIVLAALLAVTTSASARGESLVGLTSNPGGGQGLIFFDSSAPGTTSSISISGLLVGETLLGIDRRPATNQLYGLSNLNRLVTINAGTGLATGVGSGFTNALVGTRFGFDFNPQIDRIRIVSDADQNFVAHPDTGNANVAVTTPVFYPVGDLNAGANPNVVHHAYDRNFAGTGATQLRAIDTNLDILVTQANNAGTLGTIGSLGLGVDATDVGGFDVSRSGAAFAIFNSGGPSSALYSINLATGAATSLGSVQAVVTGLAAVPEPSSVCLLVSAGLIGLVVRRHRTSSS